MLHIELDLESLTIDSTSPLFVAGALWLKIDDQEFPERGWTDSPLSVIGSLGSVISHLRMGEEADMYFFAGAFFVKFVPMAPFVDDFVVQVWGVYDGNVRLDSDDEGIVQSETRSTIGEIEERFADTVAKLQEWSASLDIAELTEMLDKISAVARSRPNS